MCGICGIRAVNPPRGVVEIMTDALTHRGPDDSGYYWDPQCALGMRRLKIIDLDGSHQPIRNEDQSIALVCNGEIYNYRSLRAQLQERGHEFQTQGDVEVIVHLYEELGLDCVEKLRGMFAFALWDRSRSLLMLARDRMGIKPLYYLKLLDRLVFSSEIRSIISSGLITPELDPEAVARYCAYPAIPAPLTVFRYIKALQPGHYLWADHTGIHHREYWDVDFVRLSQSPLPRDTVVSTVRDTLADAVNVRLMSDVPLGAFLSGGIDSSSVVALMSRLTGGDVRTFSIRFAGDEDDFKWFDDASYAARVAREFNATHTEEIVTGDDVRNNLMDAVWAMDQPSGDALQYYLVSQSARKGVTVALSGTGGDEVFAGYEWFKEMRRIEQIHYRLRWITPALAQSMLALLHRFPRDYELGPLLHKIETVLLGRSGFAMRYRLNRRLYRSLDWDFILSADLRMQLVDYNLDGNDNIEHFAYKCSHLDPVSRTSYLQLKTDLPDLLLRDQDAVSMAHSLEVRLPLVDHVVVETAARVPPDLKLRGMTEKYILRKALEELLPGDISSRTKKGFIFPMHIWMRNELRPVVESCLSREAVARRGLFNPDTAEKMKRDFFNGNQPFFKVWNQVVFELWCRIVLDRPRGWERPVQTLKDFL